MPIPSDLDRRNQVAASGPKQWYEKISWDDLIVGTAARQLVAGPAVIPAVTLILQADVNNGGIISIRDSLVTAAIAGTAPRGWQIGAGQMLVLSVTDRVNQNNYGGLAPGVAAMMRGAAPGVQRISQVVMNLADFWVIATLMNQNLHIGYMNYVPIGG